MASLPAPTRFDPKIHTHLISSIVETHTSCILTPPYTGGTFMPPLDNAQMMAWWTSRAKEVAEGVREIIIQLTPKASALQDEVEVVGMVMLATPFAQTGSFRGYVEKLCVRDDWRGKGIAGNLMKELDTVALERGRPLMMLDTEGGSPAELMYPKWGWIRVGAVPNYEFSPGDGSFVEGVFFYKDLRQREA